MRIRDPLLSLLPSVKNDWGLQKGAKVAKGIGFWSVEGVSCQRRALRVLGNLSSFAFLTSFCGKMKKILQKGAKVANVGWVLVGCGVCGEYS